MYLFLSSHFEVRLKMKTEDFEDIKIHKTRLRSKKGFHLVKDE